MPNLQQAEQVQKFADEIFELSKMTWAAQNRGKAKGQAELTEMEFLSLDIVFKAGRALHVGEIQKELGVLPAQMSRIIRSLEHKAEKPLVKCTINPQDKRKIDVELTAAGKDAHQAYRKLKLGSMQKILEDLSPADREEFMRILRVIRENMHRRAQPESV